MSYFGQKDISQCILIKSMVSDLNIPVKIIVAETMRESDGLAMSSRNVYLSQEERGVASILYNALQSGNSIFEKMLSDGKDVASSAVIINEVQRVLATEKLISRIEYISLASPHDMRELEDPAGITSSGAVLSSAVRLGSVRLIDNILIGHAHNVIYS